MIYWREGLLRPVVVTRHKDIPMFEIRSNLRTLGISVEEYSEILKKIK